MAHIAYFRQTFVQEKQWFSEAQFAELLSICQLLPGPASSQLGFAIGLLRAGYLGGLIAFVSFTLPSVLLLMAFSQALPLLSSHHAAILIHGLKLVAIIVVADAIINMANKLCTETSTRMIALAALALSLFPMIANQQLILIVLAGIIGWQYCKAPAKSSHVQLALGYSTMTGSLLLMGFVLLLIWSVWPADANQALTWTLMQRFYQVGALVFGGGHVVLPLLTDATNSFESISQTDLLTGYGAAQALPGPLFSVASFYGSHALGADTWHWDGAMMALIAIFLPGFLLIAGLLPWWQSIHHYRAIQQSIQGINASVIGLLAATWYQPLMTTGIHRWQDIAICLLGYGLLKSKTLPLIAIIGLVISLSMLQP